MGDLTEHFNRSEFRCPCGCGKANIDPHLVHVLQGIRWMLEQEFGEGPWSRIVIASGVRCIKYNKKVGGSGTSAHLQTGNESFGYAADIHVVNTEWAHYFVRLAYIFGIQRIGFGKKDGKEQLHIDTHPTLPQPRLWGY